MNLRSSDLCTLKPLKYALGRNRLHQALRNMCAVGRHDPKAVGAGVGGGGGERPDRGGITPKERGRGGRLADGQEREQTDGGGMIPKEGGGGGGSGREGAATDGRGQRDPEGAGGGGVADARGSSGRTGAA